MLFKRSSGQPMQADRRGLLIAACAGVAVGLLPGLGFVAPLARRFPKGFLWGAATAGHQIEGNNVNSDIWLLENVKPTIFSEPSLNAV
jgi:beta-glucosidase